MAYRFTTNITGVPGAGTAQAKLQGNRKQWFQRHEFTVEITTTPQSFHKLIEAQLGPNGLNVRRFPYRVRLKFANPPNLANQPTIFIGTCPDLTPDATPLAEYAIEPGENEVIDDATPRFDYQIWCANGTAGLVALEIG